MTAVAADGDLEKQVHELLVKIRLNMSAVLNPNSAHVIKFSQGADKVAKFIDRVSRKSNAEFDLMKAGDAKKLIEALKVLAKFKPSKNPIKNPKRLLSNQELGVRVMKNISTSKYLLRSLQKPQDLNDLGWSMRLLADHYSLANALWQGDESRIKKEAYMDTSVREALPQSVYNALGKMIGEASDVAPPAPRKLLVTMTAVAADENLEDLSATAAAKDLVFRLTQIDSPYITFFHKYEDRNGGMEVVLKEPADADYEEGIDASDMRMTHDGLADRLTRAQQKEFFKKYVELTEGGINKGDTITIKGPIRTQDEMRSKYATPANIKKLKALFPKIQANLKGVLDPSPKNLQALIKTLRVIRPYFRSFWEKKRINEWRQLSDAEFKRIAELLKELSKIKPKKPIPDVELTGAQKVAVALMKNISKSASMDRMTYGPSQNFNSFPLSYTTVYYILASALWTGDKKAIKKALDGLDPDYQTDLPVALRSAIDKLAR